MGKPKDPLEFPIKWSVVRREVFKIHPIYRQEYEVAFQDYLKGLPSDLAVRPQAELRKSFIHSPQARELCQRWGLSLAKHPDDKVWDNPPESVPLLFADPGLAVKVIPFGKIKSPEYPWHPIDKTPLLKEGRYLCLEIDLFKSAGQIEVEIKNEVQRFQAEIFHWLRPWRGPSLNIYLDEEPPGGPVTIFQVWKMNKQGGKSPWKIAQELYPKLKGTSYQDKARNYDSNAKRLHQQIVEAINRVHRLIDSITPLPEDLFADLEPV
jgi:hypothetical protein